MIGLEWAMIKIQFHASLKRVTGLEFGHDQAHLHASLAHASLTRVIVNEEGDWIGLEWAMLKLTCMHLLPQITFFLRQSVDID